MLVGHLEKPVQHNRMQVLEPDLFVLFMPLCTLPIFDRPEITRCAIETCEQGATMSLLMPAIDKSTLGLHSLEDYEPIIGAMATERIFNKADQVRTMQVVHVSSTFYGGGVTEILAADVDHECDWHRDRVASGSGYARLLQLYEKATQHIAR